jgi:SAM-dependent methyltransferase
MKAIIKKITPYFIIKGIKDYQKQKLINSYQGDQVFCPICQSRFKMFAPYGVKKRNNAKCLNCDSLERHRLLFLFLTNRTNVFEDKAKIRLLHSAPERAFYGIFSQTHNIEYLPCDLFPELYDFKGNIEVQKIDITKIPFEDSYFDVILCNHVLEHIPDDIKAMTELYRVMKKGGWGILQVPIDYTREKTYEDFTITTPKERVKAFGQRDHVRWYGQDYIDRLKSVGFKVTEDEYIKSFSSDELFQLGLMPSEIIYYCQK